MIKVTEKTIVEITDLFRDVFTFVEGSDQQSSRRSELLARAVEGKSVDAGR